MAWVRLQYNRFHTVFTDAGAGERIPRFAEAAALCRELGLLANVEIKPATGHEAPTARLVARLTAELWRGLRYSH